MWVNDKVVSSVAESLKYYFKDFDIIKGFYELAIENISEDNNKRTILIYIHYAWLEGTQGAKSLCNKAISKWGNSVARVIIDIALSYISNPKYTDKCFKLLYFFIHDNDKNVINGYSHGFLIHDKVDLILLYPFIEQYIDSASFVPHGNSFFDYLFKQSEKHPDKVLEIMQSIDWSKKYFDKETFYDDDIHLQVILGAFNSIRMNKNKYLTIATDIFDSILRNSKRFHYMINDLDNSLL